MDNLYRVIGPPGTGKTTYLAEQCKRAYNIGRFPMVVSLTRAAAAEIAGRDTAIDPKMIGTLHAQAYRALGQPQIADDGKHIAEFNQAYPNDAINPDQSVALDGEGSSASNTDDDPRPTGYPGNVAYARLNLYRARLTDPADWDHDTTQFATKWAGWKRDNNYLDFTDLIEQCLYDGLPPPGEPDVMFVDEGQDFDHLQMALVREWGRSCKTLAIVGDADQCIYSWRGSDPEAFMSPPELPGHRRMLSQSRRVPVAPHAYAREWIRQWRRRPVDAEYSPRVDNDGQPVAGALELRRDFRLDDPDVVMADVLTRLAERPRGDDEHYPSVMILTACAYQLIPIVGWLKATGTPFYNPYATKRGDWNPLRGVGRVRAFVNGDEALTGKGMRAWAEVVKADNVFRRGGKSWTEKLTDTESVSVDQLLAWCHESAVSAILTGDPAWLVSVALDRYKRQLAYGVNVWRRHGLAGLTETPRVCVGTIHSVKGGQADHVYVFPDLSYAGARAWSNAGMDGYDAILRQYYVALTRCRERLVLCDRSSPLGVDWLPNTTTFCRRAA